VEDMRGERREEEEDCRGEQQSRAEREAELS
jgi:hypothetical protein